MRQCIKPFLVFFSDLLLFLLFPGLKISTGISSSSSSFFSTYFNEAFLSFFLPILGIFLSYDFFLPQALCFSTKRTWKQRWKSWLDRCANRSQFLHGGWAFTLFSLSLPSSINSWKVVIRALDETPFDCLHVSKNKYSHSDGIKKNQ